eukprot:scaffold25553_cov34-Prasinocladus_malaysianus.AAC.1
MLLTYLQEPDNPWVVAPPILTVAQEGSQFARAVLQMKAEFALAHAQLLMTSKDWQAAESHLSEVGSWLLTQFICGSWT